MSGPRIIVAAALEPELASLRPQAASWPSVMLARVGPGAERATVAIEALIRRHRPTLLLHIGFAGGLDPVLRAGDVLPVGRVLGGGEPVVLDQAHGRAILLSVDKVIPTPAAKARLFRERLAAAVDMETYAVAVAARKLGVPMIALRAISDPADAALPASSLSWLTRDGRPRLLPPIAWALAHPWRIPDLVRLGRASKLAAERLADEAERIIREHL